jgi:rfaE bifunctional protein kinase chain/domain
MNQLDRNKIFLSGYPEEVEDFLKSFARKYNFKKVTDGINKLQKLKVLLLGDGIIDEYHYCEPLGRSNKAPIIVNKYSSHEVFAGGAFAIANHIAGLCGNVQLVSLLGASDSREDFIANNVNSIVKTKFFYREDGPTIVKKRYINQYLNQKLFEVNYLNDNYIKGELESEIIGYLKKEIPSYDIVLISDFGHGFITEKIIKFIERYSKKFAVNTQTNGANAGYNMITKYRNPTYVCLDESEIRLSAQDRYNDIEFIVKKVARQINSDYFIVTRGKNGSMGINRTNKINRTPVFSTKVVDTVGAGDAFFAYTAPCIACCLPLDLVSFVGNIAGALAVQIVGNKKPVKKNEFFEFAAALLR